MATATIVSLINMKGGVGKTTLAVGLAWELAKSFRVLLVDIDPQFNATQWIVDPDKYLEWLRTKHTVLDIFSPAISSNSEKNGKVTPSTSIIPVQKGDSVLYVLPSTIDLMQLDAAPRGTENKLRVYLDKVRHLFDYVLIDCPPTASLFSYSAFLASDAYLVPVKPDPLSVLGLPLLNRAMKDYEERSGHHLPRLGLVFTQVRQTEAMSNTMQQVRGQYVGEVFRNTIAQTTGVAEAVEENTPLQTYKKSGNFSDVKASLIGICSEFVDRAKELSL
ncbi:ParA family protein [Acidovorax sp. JMULE5]|uniref:ParA family protein n=1 Tax=Acidovorax sp. JMULE5 TaxID=2518343 RepID=UPI0015A3070D|nr:ParA family protein [Acidovorax sp. JMULE5]QLA79357.1 ParA family protein [Acidovorax sp. JMULE5]